MEITDDKRRSDLATLVENIASTVVTAMPMRRSRNAGLISERIWRLENIQSVPPMHTLASLCDRRYKGQFGRIPSIEKHENFQMTLYSEHVSN